MKQINDIRTALQEFNEAEMAELLATMKKEAKEEKLKAATHACLRNAEIERAPLDLRTAWANYLATNSLQKVAQTIALLQELWGTTLHWTHIAQFFKRPGQGLFLGTHFSFREEEEDSEPNDPPFYRRF